LQRGGDRGAADFDVQIRAGVCSELSRRQSLGEDVVAEPVRCPDGKTAVLAPPLHEHAAKTAFPVNPAVRGAVEGAGAGEAQVVRTQPHGATILARASVARR